MQLRKRVERVFVERALAFEKVLREKRDLVVKIENERWFLPYVDESSLHDQLTWSAAMYKIASGAKTILFRSEQAKIFVDAYRTYFDELDYRLPFSHVFLQFDQPVVFDYTKRQSNDIDRGRLIAMALDQVELTAEDIERDRKQAHDFYRYFNRDEEPSFYSWNFNSEGVAIVNRIIFLYEDWGIDHVSWQSSGTDERLKALDDDWRSMISLWKNLAIACIGYINCENVYLHREEGASEKINRKREAKGKSKLEPYYVCRIRGVNYDSVGTGIGSTQSIRYDVRGHFRHLTSGKTIWVRPHQRGLANELYVPKTYVVDKRNDL